jgi:hypothetical protein
MTLEFNLTVGGTLNDGYTIKSKAGCRLVFGSVPVSDLSMLTHGYSKKALMATDIADLIGAAFVIGEPADLDALRKLDLPVSEKRQKDYLAAHNMGLISVAMWLRNGDRGSSSNAMCKRLFGVPIEADKKHPNDPGDLQRCIAFLDAAKANDNLPGMADVSPEWGRLVAIWGDLMTTLQGELAKGKSAPKTYAMMKNALSEKSV